MILVKIKGIPKDFDKLSFGQKMQYSKAIQEFKESAKSTWLTQKRQSYKKALREAINLHGIKEYYASFACGKFCHDDSFELWYK